MAVESARRVLAASCRRSSRAGQHLSSWTAECSLTHALYADDRSAFAAISARLPTFSLSSPLSEARHLRASTRYGAFSALDSVVAGSPPRDSRSAASSRLTAAPWSS